MYLAQFVALSCKQTLENRRMFRVDRKNDCLVAAHGINHQTACCHQGFLVGKGHYLSCLQSRKGGFQSAKSDHRSDDYIDVWTLNQTAEAVLSRPDLAGSVGKFRI